MQKRPFLRMYKNCFSHPINFIFGGGTTPQAANLQLKLRLSQTSGSSVIKAQLEKLHQNMLMMHMMHNLMLFSNFEPSITGEPLVPLIFSFRCRLGTYGMVPPPKLKLIGWLQQFIYMLKLGSSSNFALSACFDEIFQLSVLITDEPLV